VGCTREAVGLQEAQDNFRAETGLNDFRFLFALYEGGAGGPATTEDCAAYAENIGDPDFPVFADGDKQISEHTPMTQERHPEMCALAPDMTIITCFAGHESYGDALQAIRDHAGL